MKSELIRGNPADKSAPRSINHRLSLLVFTKYLGDHRFSCFNRAARHVYNSANPLSPSDSTIFHFLSLSFLIVIYLDIPRFVIILIFEPSKDRSFVRSFVRFHAKKAKEEGRRGEGGGEFYGIHACLNSRNGWILLQLNRSISERGIPRRRNAKFPRLWSRCKKSYARPFARFSPLPVQSSLSPCFPPTTLLRSRLLINFSLFRSAPFAVHDVMESFRRVSRIAPPSPILP